MIYDKPIEIFVRQCAYSPNSALPNRNRPAGFSKEGVWANLLHTYDHKKANITIIFDEHFGNYEGTYSSVHKINCGNEAQSFLATLDFVMSKNFSDETIIYFLEDDYLHRDKFCDILIEGISLGTKYITLYDHLDKYLHYPDLTSKIMITKSSHWRTTPSTTNTFACKMTQLRSDIDIQRKYSLDREISDDNGKFLELGGLISSIPAYSTHCDDYLSPVFNWRFS
jgi:hypothetical protein